MRPVRTISILSACLLAICAGCAASRRLEPAPMTARVETRGSPADTEQRSLGKSSTPSPGQTARRAAFTAENNPTARGLRGEPSLDDFFRPAAWIYIDGREGRFIERDGRPQVQWQIEDPVDASPTFRVEAFAPLLGTPADFVCTLDLLEAPEDSEVAYAIRATEGTFVVGRDYQLLRPGDNFIVRNRTSGDVVSELAPLVPGTYIMAGGIKNRSTGKEGLAITYFTVGEGSGKQDTKGNTP